MTAPRPIVAIPCDVKPIGLHPYHVVGEKYIEAVAHGANCTPVLLPALGGGRDLGSLVEEVDLHELLRGFDGVFLPGSASNVDPSHYGHERVFPDDQLDRQRDETTLRLIRAAVTDAVPLLAVCRGIQELNIAFGGTLHQAVHTVEGFEDHRENHDLPRAEQYRPRHEVRLTPGGVLRSLHRSDTARVNSLHGQGLDRVAAQLVVEAVAPDGLVEAVSVASAKSFALGVQWHPEWRHWEDELSSSMFAAFGQAATHRASRRTQHSA